MQGSNNLIIDLEPKLDKKEDIFHIGRLKFPGCISFNNSVTFLVFLSEEGDEEIQIAINDKENTKFSSYTKSPGKLEVALSRKEDSYKKPFYVAKVQFNGYLDCNKESTFLIFSSKENKEKLQISGEFVVSNSYQQPIESTTEVIKLRKND